MNNLLIIPFSTKVFLPNENEGALVSCSGFRRWGEYDQGEGPSMSIRSGGRAWVASSQVMIFLGRRSDSCSERRRSVDSLDLGNIDINIVLSMLRGNKIVFFGWEWSLFGCSLSGKFWLYICYAHTIFENFAFSRICNVMHYNNIQYMFNGTLRKPLFPIWILLKSLMTYQYILIIYCAVYQKLYNHDDHMASPNIFSNYIVF